MRSREGEKTAKTGRAESRHNPVIDLKICNAFPYGNNFARAFAAQSAGIAGIGAQHIQDIAEVYTSGVDLYLDLAHSRRTPLHRLQRQIIQGSPRRHLQPERLISLSRGG